MARQSVQIAAADGIIDAQFFTPEGPGPWPAVIVYTDAFGTRPAYEQVSQTLTNEGYFVLLPNPYYRDSPAPVAFPAGSFADAPVRERIMGLIATLTPEAVRTDAGALLDWLDGRPEVSPGKAAIIGHCMSGAIALRAAADYPDRIAAAASFHGGQLATDDPASPHLRAPDIKARLLICHASDDPFMPVEMQSRLHAALDEAGVPYEAEVYGGLHGWTIPGSPVYDDGEAKRARARLYELLGRVFA